MLSGGPVRSGPLVGRASQFAHLYAPFSNLVPHFGQYDIFTNYKGKADFLKDGFGRLFS